MTALLALRAGFRFAFPNTRITPTLCGLVCAMLMALPIDAAERDRPVELPAGVLDGVVTKDNEERGIRYEERDAYYRVLDHVRAVLPRDLRTAAMRFKSLRWDNSPRFGKFPIEQFPTFVDLLENPDIYQGQPVTLSGHVIHLVRSTAGENDDGIEELYEAWLYTEGSLNHPAVVVCTSIPEGMPIGDEIIDGVTATGYLFKVETYASKDRKVRFAPLILADTLQWQPPGEATGLQLSTTTITIIAATLIVLTLWFLWRLLRPKRRVSRELFERPDGVSFDTLPE